MKINIRIVLKISVGLYIISLLSCLNIFKPDNNEPTIKTPRGSMSQDLEVLNNIISINGLNISVDSVADTHNYRITILWLGGLNIDSIPPSIENMGALQTLLLNSNNISSLPTSIGKMERLEYISLSHNKMSYFPTILLTINSIKQIDLSYNFLKIIPAEAINHYLIYDYTFCMGPCGGPNCCTTTKKNGLNINYNHFCNVDSITTKWLDTHYSQSTEYYQLQPWRITQICGQ